MAIADIRLTGAWDALGMTRSDGSVWGVGYHDGLGFLEQDPNSQFYQEPLVYPWQYLGIGTAKKFVLTANSSGLVLREDGTVWVTGYQEGPNGNTLGLGSRIDTFNNDGTDYQWVKIPGLSGIVEIEAGDQTVIALASDGRLYGWGYGLDGQFSSGGTAATTPTQVHGLDDVIDFSVGADHMAVVREDGSLWTWGYSSNGGLGQGVAHGIVVTSPVQIDTGVERVECGWGHTLYRKTDGALWGAGDGLALGLGDADYLSPEHLTGPGNVTDFSAGDSWSIAINASTGRVWSVGYNRSGQLGRASLDFTDSFTWGLVEGPGGGPVVAVDVHAGLQQGMYVLADCSVFAWGQNTGRYLGTISWKDELATPTQIVKNTDWEYDAWDGNIIDYAQTMEVFEYDSVVLTDTGAVYQWGGNLSDEDWATTGDSGYAREYPTLIATLPGAVKIGTIPGVIYAIKDDGTVWRMGYVPDPDWDAIAALNYSSLSATRVATDFEQVPGLVDMVDISTNGGTHVAVQDSLGQVWGIGKGEFGALGLNALRPQASGPQPWITYSPDGVQIDAAGAVASMSGDKLQTTIFAIVCSYTPIFVHFTGAFNSGAGFHESSHFVYIPPEYWPAFGAFYNVWIQDTSNAFPTIIDDYATGYDHGVYIIGGVAYVSGSNESGSQGNGTTQSTAGLVGDGWWSDDDLVTTSNFEPFAEPQPVCFKDTTTPISDFVEVLAVGGRGSGILLRRANGEVWGWGSYSGEAIGDPSLPSEDTEDAGQISTNGGWPIHIPLWDEYSSVYMTWGGGLAQKDDGTLWGWGDAIQAGQGYQDGSTYYSPPVPIFPGEPRATDANFLFACDDPLENGGGDEGPPVDGRPPDTIPNEPLTPPGPGVVPVPPPVGGGCRASMDSASSCNYDVPIPDEIPLPDDEIEFPDIEIPDFTAPDFPIDEIEIPEFPIDCFMPDFGNLADCKPKAGTGGGLPGGRDNKGKRGSGHAGIKLGGPTYKKRRQTFNQHFPRNLQSGDPIDDPDTGEPVIPPQRSWPAGSSVMTAIMVILLDLGISPLKIIFEIGPEWDKTFGPKTFPETTPMFAAAEWLAQRIMCRIIDEGAPTGNIYIGPPTHHPHSQTWTFVDYFPNPEDNPPFFNIVHGYSGTEAYFAVKVWGAHFSPPKFALVDTIFARDPQNLLEIEVGPDYSPGDAQDLANYRAALIRQAAVSVQITVPYNEGYFMRDTMVVQATSRGYQETYIIFGKQSDVGIEGNTHILTGVLPATLEMLTNFPDVLEDPEPVGLAFLDAPEAGQFAVRPETKRKAEGRVQRQLGMWALREGVKATMNGSR